MIRMCSCLPVRTMSQDLPENSEITELSPAVPLCSIAESIQENEVCLFQDPPLAETAPVSQESVPQSPGSTFNDSEPKFSGESSSNESNSQEPVMAPRRSVERSKSDTKFKRLSDVLQNDNLCDLMRAYNTFVYYKQPYVPGTLPFPLSPNDSYPVPLHYVKLPFQESPLMDLYDKKLSRWELIEEVYSRPINNVVELIKSIKQYNRHLKMVQFDILIHFINRKSTEDCDDFFNTTLPRIIQLALNLPIFFSHNLAYLDSVTSKAVFLSQQQISSLIANAFLCTYMGNERRSINFNNLFASDGCKLSKKSCKLEKLKCMMNYLRRVTQETPIGTVSFERTFSNRPIFEISDKPITKFEFNFNKCLIEDGSDYSQVDFAHKIIGGGVLDSGCVQEEILFSVCPELIVAKLICAELVDKEAVIITGVEQFNLHDGYADDFRWDSSYRDTLGRDKYGRKFRQILAMDALHFHWKAKKTQYEQEKINRELLKASAAFQPERYLVSQRNLPAIATGNWGCGVYNGDVYLKAMIQIIAASQAGRELVYFTYNDKKLMETFNEIQAIIQNNNKPVTVSKMYRILLDFAKSRAINEKYDLAVHLAMNLENDEDALMDVCVENFFDM